MRSIPDALASLGSTSQEVATTLLNTGISNCLIHPSSCPVAKFLQQKTGNYNLHIGYTCGEDIATQEVFLLPTPVREFIKDLEDHKYPLLY